MQLMPSADICKVNSEKNMQAMLELCYANLLGSSNYIIAHKVQVK